jgi:hypothetical protein
MIDQCELTMTRQRKRRSAEVPDTVRADFSLRYPAGKWLQVMNWPECQLYSEKNPPWYKICTSLLKHPNYRCLSPQSKLLVHELFALAAQNTVDGIMAGDPELLAEELGWEGELDLEPLLTAHEGADHPFVRYLTREQKQAESERIRKLIAKRPSKKRKHRGEERRDKDRG